MAIAIKKVMGVVRNSAKRIAGKRAIPWEVEDTTWASSANLMAYWRLEGDSLDETAANNDGTDTNITYSAANGRFGQGADFNGTTSRIQCADSTSLSITGALTINCWVNPDALPASGGLVSLVCKFESNATKGGYDLRLYNNAGTQNIGLVTYATSQGGGDVAVTLSTGVWSMVTATYSGSYSSIYVNGAAIGQVANTVNPANNTKLLNIGNYGLQGASELGRYFNGKMDDISIFNTWLTSTEILNIYLVQVERFMGVTNR